MSDGLLFDVPETPSPRLAWIRRHGVVTYFSPIEPAVWYAGFAGGSIRDAAAWFIAEQERNGDLLIGFGTTEDEAITQAAIKNGIRLWNEEAGA